MDLSLASYSNPTSYRTDAASVYSLHRIMFISLIYTTARPHLIDNVISRWFRYSHDENNIEMIIATDEAFNISKCKHQITHVINTSRRDCVTGWNLAASIARGDIIIQVSDDLYPPTLWDASIVNDVKKHSTQRSDIVINYLDDRMCQDAIYHPVLTRDSYNHTGYLYPPEFESMYCDNWFYAFHRKYSLLVCSDRQFWTHKHRTTHRVNIDEVTLRHESPQRYSNGYNTLKYYAEKHDLTI